MTFKPLTFELAFNELLLIEGGKSGDAGGTNFGVDQATLNAFCDKHQMTRFSVNKLTTTMAGAIYRENYWVPLNIAQLRPDFGLTLFIQAVNLPWREAVRIMQGVLMRRGAYSAQIDGEVGPATIQATFSMAEGTIEAALDGYAADYAIDQGKDRHGLIVGRLQKIAEAVNRLEKGP